VKQPKNPKEKGAILLLGTLSMLFIVPMMGLAVDVGFLYAVKSKLQASVDGAALAAARALNIGSTLSAQESSATSNATTWFNANFPSGYFGTYNTSISTPTYNSSNQVMSIGITATTSVDSFFMKWLGFGATTISANGTASRRTVVAMLVLDRSGSMCNGGSDPCAGTGNSLPCSAMVSAAKAFTGQFQEGTDYIGMVSFSENVYIHSVPVTNFQSVLGYSNASGSSSGAIDTLYCGGGTSTALAMSTAYQELYEAALPGGLNVIALETDGMPNTLAMNFWDSTNSVAGLLSTSNCLDANNKKMSQGGFNNAAAIPKWSYGWAMNGTSGQTNKFGVTNAYTSPNSTTTGYYANVPAGMVAEIGGQDPSQSGFAHYFEDPYYYSSGMSNATTNNTPGQGSSPGSTTDPYNDMLGFSGYYGGETYNPMPLNGCAMSNGEYSQTLADIAWFPSTDVFGNSLNPSYGYLTVTADGQGHIQQSGLVTPNNFNNYHNAVLNATENSAYVVRSNSTLPTTVFAIGLGGNATLDYVLLQRMANDPNGDEFNTTGPEPGGGYYLACSQETNCATFSSQPQGTFIYAPSTTYLAEAFLRISSQVLRLSK
jgi:Flp pilus assembly protein TadG